MSEMAPNGKEKGKKRGLAASVERSVQRSRSYEIDLRVHSPAALGSLQVEGLQTAPALVRLAQVKGIDMLGITDLFGCDFIDEVKSAAADRPVSIIPGVDLRCQVGDCRDVILSCFFSEQFGSTEVRNFLSSIGVSPKSSGRRDVVVRLPFGEVLAKLDEFGGVGLPSQIDRTPLRLSIVPELVERFGFRAFEIAYGEETPKFFKSRWPKTKFQLFTFSNATALAQVGSRTAKLKMSLPGFEGLRSIVARELQA